MHPYTCILFVLCTSIFTGSGFHGHVGMVKIFSMWKFAARVHVYVVIGVSLSEPHTSETALQDACVCLLTDGHMLKIWVKRTDMCISNLHTCWSSVKVNNCLLLTDPYYLTPRRWIYWMRLRTLTDKARLLTDGPVKSRTLVEFTSGKGHA